MQQLTAGPRSGLAESLVRSILTADAPVVDFGLELVDTAGNVLEDLTPDLLDGQVERNCYADVHGTCSLKLSRELAWGRDRVRPFMVLSDGVVSARFDLGVFVLTTPQRPVGETPTTFDVQGYDLLYLLQQPVGDTYVVESGTTYLQAVRDAVTASGAGSSVLLDGTGQDTPLPGDLVWCLSDSEPASWLRVVNDLLAAIGYRGVWCDESGAFRSEPYRDPAVRPVEWVYDAGAATILGADRVETNDVWSAPNWWRFVRKDMTTQPVEGAGIYTVQNASTGASSQASVGRVVRAATQYLDAADQASLTAQGDRIVATDMAVTRLVEGTTGPFPIAGHFDVALLDDPQLGGRVKVQARSWSMPLDGGDLTVTWEVVGA